MKNDKKETLYCTHCGAKLIHITKPQEKKFDRDTGKPTNALWNYWRCPNKRFFFDSHDTLDDEPINQIG